MKSLVTSKENKGIALALLAVAVIMTQSMLEYFTPTGPLKGNLWALEMLIIFAALIVIAASFAAIGYSGGARKKPLAVIAIVLSFIAVMRDFISLLMLVLLRLFIGI